MTNHRRDGLNTLRRIIRPAIRSETVPVIGFSDGVTVTVVGIRVDGAHGPSVKASARSGQTQR